MLARVRCPALGMNELWRLCLVLARVMATSFSTGSDTQKLHPMTVICSMSDMINSVRIYVIHYACSVRMANFVKVSANLIFIACKEAIDKQIYCMKT